MFKIYQVYLCLDVQQDPWRDFVDATMVSTTGLIISVIPGGGAAILAYCNGAGRDASC